MNNVDVPAFASPANVVSFTQAAVLQNEQERGGVIIDKYPVADVHSITVNRQWLVFDCIENCEGDQLLGELVRAVVVPAAGDNSRQVIGMNKSRHQVIGGCFARRVGRVGVVGGGFS